MGDSVHVAVADHVQNLLHVDPGRSQGDKAERLVGLQFRIDLEQIQIIVGEDLAHEAEAVAVDSGGGYSNEDIPSLYLRAVDESGFLHDTCGEASDVIFTVLVHSRHLGGLSAHEGASGLTASVSDSGHDGLYDLRTGLSLGHIVKEHKRFRSLGQNVVHAHRHGVDADGVVLVHRERQLELSADSVRPADQDRFLDVQF